MGPALLKALQTRATLERSYRWLPSGRNSELAACVGGGVRLLPVITTEALGLPTEVPVDERHGLKHESVVDCEDLYIVGADAILGNVGEVDSETQSAVDGALRLALDLRE